MEIKVKCVCLRDGSRGLVRKVLEQADARTKSHIYFRCQILFGNYPNLCSMGFSFLHNHLMQKHDQINIVVLH